jgi:hypothetical protein
VSPPIEDRTKGPDDRLVTPEEFAAAVKIRALDSAVCGVLQQLKVGAPGRGPQRAEALTSWYGDLTSDDQGIAEVVRNAAHAAVLGLLCVLDGVAVIDNPPHADLVLTGTDHAGETTVLTSGDTVVELHDEFNALVHPPSEPWPSARDI